MAILASGNMGFIDVQTLITQLLSYFRVITNPKAVFLTTESISENIISDDETKKRLRELVDDTLKIATKLSCD
jgi:NAD(P)H-dependent FMN reductase